MFRDFSSSICRPNSALIVYGYGFGDSHINKIIKEMLNIPSTHIVVIAYSVDERLLGFLRGINLDQVTLLCGAEIASIDKLVSYYLPKSAIDKISLSVAKLLKEREIFSEKEESKEENQQETNE